MEKMSMRNVEVEHLGDFLMSIKLKGRNSRLRTRFVKTILTPRIELIGEERMALVKEYANLDEDGEPKIITEGEVQKYDIKDEEEFNKEFADLINEPFDILVDDENRKMIEAVQNAVLDCEVEFSGEQALVFDRYCDIVEGITASE